MSDTPGVKYDDDKLKYHLFDVYALAWGVASLTFGAVKYDEENWRKVDNLNNRYYASLMRHLEAWRSGEEWDPESGLHHLSGVMFAAMCLTASNAPRDLKMIAQKTKEAIDRWRSQKSKT